ncbi:hypothetical protein F5Y13DRAFT_186603 [Hypoxylon sp. FL1857]|nr:hypothetical protein F5Y13DRAFT_186603 [Hypoxylon sp. FL1857]
MKFTSGPLFATLALSVVYLPGVLADGITANKGPIVPFRREVANNGTAAANGTEVVDNNNNDGEENVDDNANGDENANEEENADDQQNADDENQNQDENLEDELNNVENDGINIDENNLEDSLQQNIGNLMLSLGICNFDLGSIGNIGIGNEIQLLLQLQQLAQLQQLGLVNSFSIEQLIQQELLLNNFNLNIIKRTVSASVKQAARANKRTIMTKRACNNKNNGN